MEFSGRRLLLPVTFLTLAGALPSVWAQAEGVFDSISHQVQGVYEKARSAVVRIRADDRHGRCVGSGFFIEPTGLIYTSYAVGGESENIVVEAGENAWHATRLIADPRSGVALLKVDATTPFLPLSSSRLLKVASPVVAVGYPMDLPASPSFGLIGGFDLKSQDRYFTTSHIRANVPVQRGEGGAPLLNTSGEVVGILISGLDNGAACYALPIEAAEKIRNDYLRFGEVRHGWIGITVSRDPVATEGSRARIDVLSDKTPAAESGLKSGDIVLKVGQITIRNPEDVLDGSFFLTAGDEVPVEVLRGQEHIVVSIPAIEHSTASVRSLQAQVPVEELGDSLRLRSK